MTVHWAVLLPVGNDTVVYGPFTDAEDAKGFADFLTAEVDPATLAIMRSPMREVLGWRREFQSSGGGM